MIVRGFNAVRVATALILLGAPSLGLAETLLPVTGSTSGSFVDPYPTKGHGNSISYDFSNKNTKFTWGKKSGDVGRNWLSWTNNTPINTLTETDFKLGTLTYFNGTTTSGTNPDSIHLKINLALNNPFSTSQDFTFKLDLHSTPNTGNAVQNADFVYIPSAFTTQTFTVGNIEYTLELLGFRNVGGSGFVTVDPSKFHVKEGGTAWADLYGRVTANIQNPGTPPTPGAVPEPASIISAAVAGLASLTFAARRRAASRG